MSELHRLIGKRVKSFTYEINNTYPLKPLLRDKEDFDLYTQIQFDEYSLNIYNKYIMEVAQGPIDFENQVLSRIDENDEELIFHFGEIKLKVDMSDKGYSGPEALSLYGPDNLAIVWN